MTEVLHANIFFFITGVAVIVFTALLCVALFHGIKLLKSFRRVMDRVEEGTEIIVEDMHNVREYFSGGLFGRLIKIFTGSTHEQGETIRSKRGDKKRTELKIKDEA